MPSVATALNELTKSIFSIFSGLVQSVLAVFNAILALGQNIIGAVLNLGQALFKAAVDVLGGTVGLIWGNLFLISLVGGGYYLYQANAQKSSGRGKKRA